MAAAMENDAELMAAVGAARERAVETVRATSPPKSSARGGLEEYRARWTAEFEGTIDALTASMGMTASPDQKNTFNSAFDAFAAANASIYKSSADFRRECVDLLAKRAPAELGSPSACRFDAQSRISDYIGSSHASRPPRRSLTHGLVSGSSCRRAQAHRPGPGRADAPPARRPQTREGHGRTAPGVPGARPGNGGGSWCRARPGLSPQPSRLRQRPHRSMRRRSRRPRGRRAPARLINGIGTSLRSDSRQARAGATPPTPRSPSTTTSRPRPTTSSSSLRDAEREGERSAGDRDLARSAVPRLARQAAAGAAWAVPRRPSELLLNLR